jgi:hypothetical protein
VNITGELVRQLLQARILINLLIGQMRKTLSGNKVKLSSKPKQTTQGSSKNSKPKRGKKPYRGQGK